MAPVSLKRGRSWLEIGIVGCSFLAWSDPAETKSSWPLSGTVWPSTLKVPVMPPWPSRVLAKEPSSLVDPAVVPEAAVPVTLEEDNTLLPPNDGLYRLFPRRFLEEERLHVAVGEWSECDRETCTQSRPVMCETSDFKFVSNELCVDKLVEAVKECDNPRACLPGKNTDRAGKVTEGSRLPSSRNPSGADRSERSAGLKDSEGVGRGGGVRGSSATVVNGNPSEVVPSVTVVDSGDAKQGGVGASGETESTGDGAGKDERWENSVAKGEPSMSSHEQNDQKASTSKRKSSFAAAKGAAQKVDRVGGSSATGGDRFWTVLAIGAGAVGSFLAVAAFAIHQYRKEQHRHRGIMALNEFPQDNYINPFARQLSEEDRTAFKL